MVGADAVVVDISKIAISDESPKIMEGIADWLTAYSDPLILNKAFARWLRIKPLDAPHWREDLLIAMKGAPDGVVLPKTSGPDQIRTLASELYEVEQKLGLKHNSTKIIPQIGETARAALTMSDLTRDPQPRLTGFAWNADNVARALGATRTHDKDGNWTDSMRHVRATTLFLAKAMGVMAIETSASNPRDVEAGIAEARAAKHDGFTGVSAVHPRQISAINQAFSLSAQERAEAEAIIGLFATNPGVKTVEHEGKRLDQKDLAQMKEVRALGC
ncbi:CoA ester lyase [Pontixanthobacter gangjinensis]